MNTKRLLALVTAALLTVAIFTGCSAKKDSSISYGSSADNSAVITPGAPMENNSAPVSPTVTDRKLVRRVSIDLQTQDLDHLLTSISEKVGQLNGYVETSEIHIGSRSDEARYASMTVRIPAEELDAFTSHVSDAGNVTATSESAEDITLNYVATESRKKALLAEEARLLTLIDKAANLTELLQLEKRLTEIRTELETVTSQLNVYDNLVEYATVTLEINEVAEYTPNEDPGFWKRLGNGFLNSLRNAGNLFLEIIIFCACALPYLTPVMIAGVIFLLILRHKKRKKRDNQKHTS